MTIDPSALVATNMLCRYNVSNTRPRPESYREDYVTANNKSYYSPSGEVYSGGEELNFKTKEALYGNLASGAESGLDYSGTFTNLIKIRSYA